MPRSAATFSAVSPSAIVHSFGIRGFVNRQPTVVSAIRGGRRSKAAPLLSCTYGARVIDSTPPARKHSPSPALIAWAALATACRPEAHNRLTVWPGTETGSPASSDAIRATFRLSSPAWLVQPNTTSSMPAGSMFSRSTSSRRTVAARSSGRTVASPPPCAPTGVRTPAYRYASFIAPGTPPCASR